VYVMVGPNASEYFPLTLSAGLGIDERNPGAWVSDPPSRQTRAELHHLPLSAHAMRAGAPIYLRLQAGGASIWF
jgi:hypothetical protein